MERQFTASAYIFDNERVLLIWHKKFQKWLPPGGHFEENETPVEAVRREVLEEVGFEIDFLFQTFPKIDCWNAKSIETPFLCLLEDIPPYKDQSQHQHIDFIYACKPQHLHPIATSEETQYRWFTKQEIDSLESDKDIFNESKIILENLFSRLKFS